MVWPRGDEHKLGRPAAGQRWDEEIQDSRTVRFNDQLSVWVHTPLSNPQVAGRPKISFLGRAQVFLVVRRVSRSVLHTHRPRPGAAQGRKERSCTLNGGTTIATKPAKHHKLKLAKIQEVYWIVMVVTQRTLKVYASHYNNDSVDRDRRRTNGRDVRLKAGKSFSSSARSREAEQGGELELT